MKDQLEAAGVMVNSVPVSVTNDEAVALLRKLHERYPGLELKANGPNPTRLNIAHEFGDTGFELVLSSRGVWSISARVQL